MNSGGYKIWNKDGIHFVSFATVEWIDVFTRKEYKDIIIESLRYSVVRESPQGLAQMLPLKHGGEETTC